MDEKKGIHMTKPENETKTENVTIAAPNLHTAEFRIQGTAPYVQHKFSEKSRAIMMEAQAGGQQSRSKKKREPKDFHANFLAATHFAEEGWAGIPAPSFRSAMIDACRLVGFKMTVAKCSIFVIADGIGVDGTPLVRMDAPEPEMHLASVRNESGVADIRARPMWRKWACYLRVRWDGDQFSLSDVTNLLNRAGMQVGIGEGRPFSKKSHGQGWGTFCTADEDAS
jgi:hypothetical protein